MTETQHIKEANKFLTWIQFDILESLKEGPKERRELCKELKIPRTTIYDNLLKLQDKKLIEKYSRNNGKRGRPIVYWKVK